MPCVAGTMTWSLTGFQATMRYMAMRATKNLMGKIFWSRFMLSGAVYTPASDDAGLPVHRFATREFARRWAGAIRGDAAVDSDLAALAVRPRTAGHGRVHAARSLHVAARLRARGRRDAAGERRPL